METGWRVHKISLYCFCNFLWICNGLKINNKPIFGKPLNNWQPVSFRIGLRGDCPWKTSHLWCRVRKVREAQGRGSSSWAVTSKCQCYGDNTRGAEVSQFCHLAVPKWLMLSCPGKKELNEVFCLHLEILSLRDCDSGGQGQRLLVYI